MADVGGRFGATRRAARSNVGITAEARVCRAVHVGAAARRARRCNDPGTGEDAAVLTPPPPARSSTVWRIALASALGVQGALAAWHLGSALVRQAGVGLSARLFASDADRVRTALGADAPAYELIRADVPADEWLLVEQPAGLSVTASGVELAGGTQADVAWLRTVHLLRNLMFPSPFVPKAMTNAAATAETMVANGRSAWLLAPGAGVAPDAPPMDRAGWVLVAENARCRLWRFRKD
jgi:hypothetical protein